MSRERIRQNPSQNFLTGVYQPVPLNRMDRWTKSAVDCYYLGCNCSKCEIAELIQSQTCKMKVYVLELVKKYGKPPRSVEQSKPYKRNYKT